MNITLPCLAGESSADPTGLPSGIGMEHTNIRMEWCPVQQTVIHSCRQYLSRKRILLHLGLEREHEAKHALSQAWQ